MSATVPADAEHQLPLLAEALARMDRVAALLERELSGGTISGGDISATDVRRQAGKISGWGGQKDSERLILPRRTLGQHVTLQAGVAQQIASENVGRMGGHISVPAAGALVVLFLCDLQTQQAQAATEAVAQIAVSPGGSWNMKLGDVLWAGNVTAVSAVGGDVYVGEV